MKCNEAPPAFGELTQATHPREASWQWTRAEDPGHEASSMLCTQGFLVAGHEAYVSLRLKMQRDQALCQICASKDMMLWFLGL